MLALLKNCLVETQSLAMGSDGGLGDEVEGIKVSQEHCSDGIKKPKDLVDITLRRMDHDRDGRISYTDFLITVASSSLPS